MICVWGKNMLSSRLLVAVVHEKMCRVGACV